MSKNARETRVTFHEAPLPQTVLLSDFDSSDPNEQVYAFEDKCSDDFNTAIEAIEAANPHLIVFERSEEATDYRRVIIGKAKNGSEPLRLEQRFYRASDFSQGNERAGFFYV